MKDAWKNNLTDISVIYYQNIRQGYGTQNFLLVMIEKLRKVRNKKGIFATVVTDLSKAFDCISHNLVTAKLRAFDKRPLI